MMHTGPSNAREVLEISELQELHITNNMGIGTGLADPAAAGPIIQQTEFLCSHYINFREHK